MNAGNRATSIALILQTAAIIHINCYAYHNETAYRMGEATHKKEVNNDIQVAYHIAIYMMTHRKYTSYAEDRIASQLIILMRNGQLQELIIN
jgi:hypothetical protein